MRKTLARDLILSSVSLIFLASVDFMKSILWTDLPFIQ